MGNAIDKAVGVMGLTLSAWGVPSDEGHKTVTAWSQIAKERGIKEWTHVEDAPALRAEDILRASQLGRNFPPKILEDAVFAVSYSSPALLAEFIEVLPVIQDRFKSNPSEFWQRLAAYLHQKRGGIGWIDTQHNWLIFAVEYWIRTHGLPNGTPPVCLWTDSAIRTIFDDAPEKKGTIRVTFADLNLYRPSGFAFRFAGGEWVRCRRDSGGVRKKD